MVDLVITATSTVAGSGASTSDMTAGATITAGQVVYREASTGLAKLADADSATLEARIPFGIALNGGAVNQPIEVARAGSITLGATMTAGTEYWLSGTPGGICPAADKAAGDRSVLIGIATSTTVFRIVLVDSGVVL